MHSYVRVGAVHVLVAIGLLVAPPVCFGWGSEGHRIVAATAERLLEQDSPSVAKAIRDLLATDTENQWTGTEVADEATWADQCRAHSTVCRKATEQWHFVDIEMDHPDVAAACFNWPALPPATPASEGPAQDCVVDKVTEFAAELGSNDPKEKLLALKYLLHFVGDIHQPLHDADHNDRGGNCVGILHGRATKPVKLHAYWDDNLVSHALGSNLDTAVAGVIGVISAAGPDGVAQWRSGTPRDWAMDGFGLARDVAYDEVLNASPVQIGYEFPPSFGKPDSCGPVSVYQLDANYDIRASEVVKEQLAKAAVRLAWLIEENYR